MKALLRITVNHSLRIAHRRLSSTAPSILPRNSTASIITETLTRKVGASVTESGVKAEPKVPLKEKFKIFWKSLYADYRDVAVETFQDAKANPRKASFYLSLTAGILYMYHSNPPEDSYFAELTKCDSEVSYVSDAIRNPYAENYAHSLVKQKIKGELRYQSFELFSVVWKHDVDKKVGIFEANCKYLKPMWTEVKERFVDIGLFGKWWMLEKRMIDFDVNPSEWEIETRQIAEAKAEENVERKHS